MKGKRHTEEQIIALLKEHEAGMKTADLCRKHGISEGTFYNWKAKYGGLGVSEAKRLIGMRNERPPNPVLYFPTTAHNPEIPPISALSDRVLGAHQPHKPLGKKKPKKSRRKVR
jgi:putative transposase